VSREKIRLLVADDEVVLGSMLAEDLSRIGCEVTLVNNGDDALHQLRNDDYDVAILDLRMPGKDGIEILQILKEFEFPPEVLLMTGHATVETALKAMKLGAYDYLTKPFVLSELEVMVRKAFEKRQLKRENLMLQSQLARKDRFTGLIISSPKMQNIFEVLKKVAVTGSPVLVTGETGTGKELIASSIHHYSQRSQGPFVDINCAAIPESMLESELFGYEAGAFTSARGRKLGLFELANGGTLFLDEVAELSQPLQGKLLRVLESKSFFRLGGTRKLQVDVRIVAATNKDVSRILSEGIFREDFYYRISNFQIALPPLRERPEDIRALAEHFLREFGGDEASFSSGVLELFDQYSWPGNVRELRIVIERAVILSSGRVVGVKDLPPEIRHPSRLIETKLRPKGESKTPRPGTLGKISVKDVEKAQILAALEKTNWHQERAAQLLGYSPSTLYRRLRTYGINRMDPKE
jgi:two-component system, NtrC family, response regulator AtoC